MESVKNLRVCDKHNASLASRGQKVKVHQNLEVMPSVAFSRSAHALCNLYSAELNEVCLSSDIPCNNHNINVFNNLFVVQCNFLDEQTGNKTDFHNFLLSC